MSDETHAPQLPEGEAPRWLDHPANQDKVFWGVVASYLLFLVLGFLPYAHHPYLAYEAIPAFHALYGLVCCVGLVLGAAWLRTVLMRDEGYYDREG